MSKQTVLIALLFPVLAGASTEPTLEGLFSEPATLMDVGMVRLEILTTEFERRVGLYWTKDDGEKEFFKAEVNSWYAAEDDRIYVAFLIMNSEATEAQLQEGCNNSMRQMGYWLRKSLPAAFSHVGRVDYSKHLLQALDERVVMRCYVSSGHDTGIGRFWASKSLGDSNISVGRWD